MEPYSYLYVDTFRGNFLNEMFASARINIYMQPKQVTRKHNSVVPLDVPLDVLCPLMHKSDKSLGNTSSLSAVSFYHKAEHIVEIQAMHAV